MAINGTSGNDTLIGTLGDDVIDGLGGNDIIHGSQGNDAVNGGTGSDRLIFTLSDAGLFAAAVGARSYNIGLSNVTDTGGLLNTSFTAVEHITFSTVGAGDFDDTINASGFNGTSLTIMLGNGNANVTGSARTDNITSGRGNNVINAGAGNDTIFASEGNDTIDGGAGGSDRVFVSIGNSALFTAPTGSRSYTITSGGISDASGALNTSISNVEAISFLTVGAGDFGDTVDFSGFVSGASGFVINATLGHGGDTVIGSSRDDFINLGLGQNVVDAGAGIDHVGAISDNRLGQWQYVSSSGSTIITTENGVVTNQVTNAELVRVGGGYSGNSVADGLTTRVDASGYTPVAGVQLLFDDHNGDDIFIGSSGNDIFGNTYTFTVGNDTYTGNGGADVYDYTVAVNALNADVITDFDRDDIIDFQFNDGIVAGQLRCQYWIGNAAFSGVVGQYRYEATGGQTYVQIDTDGDSVADRTLTLSNGQFALGETSPGSNQLEIIGDSGSSEDDFLVGTLGDDQIYAQDGNDTIAATGGMDHNYGGAGYDQLRFVTGNTDRFVQPWDSRTITITDEWVGASDGTINTYHYGMESLFLRTLDTGDYGDTVDASALTSAGLILRLGAGNDTVIGGAGDDDLGLNLGINTADAGAGYDIVYTAFDNTAGETAYVTSSGGTVLVTVNGVQVASIVNGEQVHITGYFASGVTTTLDASGYTAIDGVQLVLRDSNGSDVIIGSNGSDYLSNVSNNTLGNDVFTGNGGADVFDYTYASNGINGDTITDFDTDDTIDLRFNDGTTPFASPLLCNQFIGSAAFSDTAGEYRFEWSGGETRIQVDTDGDGFADQVMTIANGEFGLVETAAGSNILMRANLIDDHDNDDFAVGTPENDYVYTLGGDDFIAATRGIDFVDGGSGFDQLRFIMSNTGRFIAPTESRTYTITDGHVSDSSGQLNTTFTDVEQVFLNTINTGNFGDMIDGSASIVSLALRLGDGNDTVIGGAGDDNITTGLGINSVDAGGGEDLVVGQFNNDLGLTAFVTFDGSAVITTVDGVAVNSVINAELVGVQGSNFNSSVTTVDASGLTGFGGLFVFYDHNGSNISIGSAGSDMFANVHGGEAGNDVYTGNGGADIYDYTWAIGAMDGDLITDFDSDDVIDLSHNTAAQNTGGLLADQFIGTGNFTGSAGQYRYFASGGQTFVQVDTNGDGVADETLTIGNGQFALGETAAGSNILQMIGTSGTSANDTLTGTLGDDSIYAQQGNDIINGSQGTDFIDGGNGGGDRLFMNTGDASRFAAATGARTYTIGNGTITDSSGTLNTSFTSVERVAFSTVGNGDFNDIVDASGYVSAHANPLDIRLGDGDNQVIGSGGNERVFTGYGSNIVDGGSGGYDHGFINLDASGDVSVTITNVGGTLVTDADGAVNQFSNFDEVWVQGVGAGAVTLDASAYTDISGLTLVLVGHNGSDTMIGSAGNDIFANITGQVLGTDVYTGNGGADIYDYTWAADSMNGDTITDFDIDDVIDFRFNNLEPFGSPLLCNAFIGAAAFSGTAGEYRYQIAGTQTVIQLDSDGDSVADQVVTISNGAFMLAETAPGSNVLTLAAVIDPLDGIVADGYVEGATLFVDTNGNRQLDDGEAWTVTGPGGSFALNVNQGGTLVAIGGINADTGLDNTMTLTAPSDAGIVNPLTTLVQAVVDQSGGATSIEDAEAQVKLALGLDPSLDLLNLDLIAAAASNPAALEAQKAAAMIANFVAAAEGAAGSSSTTEAVLMGALAGVVADAGVGETVDLTDPATLAPLLDEALPPSTNIDAIANEVALQAETIAAATSVDAISDAQSDAQLVDYSLNNVRIGDEYDNFLYGLGGNDTLSGMGGNDRLVGGDGFDQLRGGTGADVFVAEATATKVATKLGAMSFDVIYDFGGGDKIDLASLDANSLLAGDQAFTWKGSNANKAAGDLSFKVYTSVQGAEKALGIDIDGVAGASPYSGPVTIVYGNLNGGTADFALALIGVNGVTQSDFLFA